MARDLSRLLRPKSIALFGGAWAANVIQQLHKSGYAGKIWPVHPKRDQIEGVKCFTSIDDLPSPPDASFIGVNREASIEVVRQLAAIKAGGATCFASGFLESEAESEGGANLQAELIMAAGEMPIVGPNCYGLLNYLDNVTLWPDQHGGRQVERGVAIIAQSSNVAINMTMQRWGLPIAYVLTAGNQAQTNISALADAMLEDDRVTAIGFYIEGFNDIRAFEAMAAKARKIGKPLVALKAGRSEKSQLATLTHTASLAGSSAASSALFKRLGIVEVGSVGVFLETLKLLHMFGELPNDEIASISCSGGEASLMADIGENHSFAYRDISTGQTKLLKEILGPIVTIANPLDYHTFIWGDVEKMSAVFATVMADGFGLTVLVLDMPRNDRCDPSSFDCAIEAIIKAKKQTGANAAVLTSLPEGLSEQVIERLNEAGVATLHSMEIGLAAIDSAISYSSELNSQVSVLLSPCQETEGKITLDESAAKSALQAFGLKLPKSASGTFDEVIKSSEHLSYPLALKGLGIAHKSEAGAVKIDIENIEELQAALEEMPKECKSFLAEEMVTDAIAEILIGVTRDATGMLLLTLGAGGVMTELLKDNVFLLLPASRIEILDALQELTVWNLLEGFRGKPSGDVESLIYAIEAVSRYAQSNAQRLLELDINPYIVCETGGAAVDALISLEKE